MNMTREQIEAMPAGAEMDAAVARAVGCKPIAYPAQFSASLSLAYDAAIRGRDAHPWAVELLTSSIAGGTFSAEFNGYHGEAGGEHIEAFGATLPEALCKLVLLASLPVEASR